MGVELGLSSTQARRTLRRMELEAYASVVTAFRAQGPLTAEKKSVLEDLCKLLVISQERHRAEVRRAVNDERLASVAASVYATDTEKAWRVEGQKLVASSSPKLVAHHLGHLSQAITATLATSALGAGLQRPPKDDVTAAAPPRLQNALRFVLGQNPVVAKTLPDAKRRSNKSPSNNGSVYSEARTINSFGAAATMHGAQNSSGSSSAVQRHAVTCKDEPVASATIALTHHGAAATHLVQGTLHSLPRRLKAQLDTGESLPSTMPTLTPASLQPPVIAWEKPSITPLHVAPGPEEYPDYQQDPGDQQNLEDSCRGSEGHQNPGDQQNLEDSCRGSEGHQNPGDQQNLKDYRGSEDHQKPGVQQNLEDCRGSEGHQNPGDQQNLEDCRGSEDHQKPSDQQSLEDCRGSEDHQNSGDQQNLEDCRGSKGHQNPGDQQNLEDYRGSEGHQNPGDQQNLEDCRGSEGHQNPGDQQNLEDCLGSEGHQNPGDQQDAEDQQNLRNHQYPGGKQVTEEPGNQQGPGNQQDDPRNQQNLESFQNPGGQQDSGNQQGPGGQQNVELFQNPRSQQNIESFHDPGGQQNVEPFQDPGGQQNVQDPGGQQNVESFHDPGGQQNVEPFQDPRDQQNVESFHDPGGQQNVKSFQNPRGQQNVEPFQDPGGQQNLESFRDPGGQLNLLESFQDPEGQQNLQYHQHSGGQQNLEYHQHSGDQQNLEYHQHSGDQQNLEYHQHSRDQHNSETNQDPEGHEVLLCQQEGPEDHVDHGGHMIPQGWQDSGDHADVPKSMELQRVGVQQQQAHWSRFQGDVTPSSLPAPPSLNIIVDPHSEQRCEAHHECRPAELVVPSLPPLMTSRKRPPPDSPPRPSPKRPVSSPTLPPPPPLLSISNVNMLMPLVPCFTPTPSTPLSPPPLQAIDPYEPMHHLGRALYISPPDEYCKAYDSKPVLLMYPAHVPPTSSNDCLSQEAIEQVMPSLSSDDDVADGTMSLPNEMMIPATDAALSGIVDEMVPVSDTDLSLEDSKTLSELALRLGLDPVLLNISNFFQLVQSSMYSGGLLQVATGEEDLHAMMEHDANSGFSVTHGDLGMGTGSDTLLLKEEQSCDVGVAPEVSLEAGDPLEGIPPELAKTIQAMAEQELIDHMLD